MYRYNTFYIDAGNQSRQYQNPKSLCRYNTSYIDVGNQSRHLVVSYKSLDNKNLLRAPNSFDLLFVHSSSNMFSGKYYICTKTWNMNVSWSKMNVIYVYRVSPKKLGLGIWIDMTLTLLKGNSIDQNWVKERPLIWLGNCWFWCRNPLKY